MFIFTVIPLMLIVYFAFTENDGSGIVFSLNNFRQAFEPLYLTVILHSVRLAFFSTIVCFLLGYPVAYIMAEKELSTKSILLFLFLVPMWMNFLLRTYAWLTILENNGIINTILAFFKIPKQNLLYTDQAVMLGMVYNFLPFMVLPIYTVLTKMDGSLIEAAQDLGANSVQIFLRVIFPLSLPGVVSGVTMVFMPAVTTFIISNLLGGGQYVLVGNLIEQQFLKVGDWHFGSAISVILMVIMLVTISLFSLVEPDKNNAEKGGALF